MTAPFEIINPTGSAPFVLICDHASRRLPEGYGTLGLDESALMRHIGWDIGAADVTRRLSARFNATAIFSGFSRLLIDCNRAPDDPTLVCRVSDGTVVPGNRQVDQAERAQRLERFHAPYHQAIAAHLDQRLARGEVPAIVSIHSFTPVMKSVVRPWHVGILWDADPRLPVPLMGALAAQGDIVVGDNEPYSGKTETGYSIRIHGADRGLPHVLVELRQDLIDTHQGAAAWSERFARALEGALADGMPYRRQAGA